MTRVLQPHLDCISAASAAITSLSFDSIPTHFISSLLDHSGVDNLIRDPLAHERGLFTVRQESTPNDPLLPDSDSRVLRVRQEKTAVNPLLLAKYSSGGNLDPEVYLRSASQLLQIYPVAGVSERIEESVRRYRDVSADVVRLEALVEEQRKELEVQNSSRLGGVYDDDDEHVVVTQEMIEQEEDQVRILEQKIKEMQQQVSKLDERIASV